MASERRVYPLDPPSKTPVGGFCNNSCMPTYVYQAAGDDHCLYCVKPFERRQKVDDRRLERCPECGSALRRVISAPAIAAPAPNLSEDNLGKKGFTQYRKAGKGVYEKTVGSGPDYLTDDD